METDYKRVIERKRSIRRDLYSLFKIVETVPNNIYLQNLVFLGQKAEALENNYEFEEGTSIGSPFSHELVHDYLILADKGYLLNNIDISEISITNILFKSEIPELKDKSKLEKLLELDYYKLKILAAIIKAKEDFEEIGVSDKVDLVEKIRGFLVYEEIGDFLKFRPLTEGRVWDYMNQFEEIKGELENV